MSRSILYFLVIILIITQIWGNPRVHEESRPLSLSELESRVESRAPRLPLPTPQELEALKKVAQILAMLGEQVIPTIIGETPGACCVMPAEDAPNDLVADK